MLVALARFSAWQTRHVIASSMQSASCVPSSVAQPGKMLGRSTPSALQVFPIALETRLVPDAQAFAIFPRGSSLAHASTPNRLWIAPLFRPDLLQRLNALIRVCWHLLAAFATFN